MNEENFVKDRLSTGAQVDKETDREEKKQKNIGAANNPRCKHVFDSKCY